MKPGLNFPVSEYYSDHIVDGITISRSGGWWSAVLLIDDPETDGRFMALYRWRKTANGWRTRKSFNIRSPRALSGTIAALQELGTRMDRAGSL